MNTVDRVILRRELAGDLKAIRSVNEAAFARPNEADLVDRLRTEGSVLASFVAEQDGCVVGHILFSRMLIETATESRSAVALAPIAVLPAHQRQGIGALLIRHGLDWLRGRGEQVVTVLGDRQYYARFGFSSDRLRAIATPFPVDAFMALELFPDVLDAIHGSVRYPAAFVA